eukprot:5182345-Pleurochrysis_carterae.AAC.5
MPLECNEACLSTLSARFILRREADGCVTTLLQSRAEKAPYLSPSVFLTCLVLVQRILCSRPHPSVAPCSAPAEHGPQ